PQAPFVPGRAVKIDVVQVRSHLGELLGADTGSAIVSSQPKLGLRFCQCQPQAPPSAVLSLPAPQIDHLWAGIAADQGILKLAWLTHCMAQREPAAQARAILARAA